MSDRLDLNSLRLFYDVVNARSMTRASEALRIPKSTISRKLGQLEAHVGAILLKKGPRQLATTDIGAMLYEHCRRVVEEVEEAGLETAQMQSMLRGNLRVSIPIDFGNAWLTRAMAKFIHAYPDIQLEIDANSRAVDPREERYDVVVQLGPLKESGLTYRRLATVTRGVYASPQYLKRRGAPLSVDDFRTHDCILTEQQRQDGVWTFRNRARHRFTEVAGKVTVNNIGIAREMAIGDVGLAMLPNVMCRGDVRAKRLERVLTEWESPPMHATALMVARKGIPNKTRVFLDFLASSLSEEEVVEDASTTKNRAGVGA